jgi:hypothetical protein
MAAGVTLKRSIETFGHQKATTTKDVVTALRALNIECADRLKRPIRKRPTLPHRCIAAIHRPKSSKEKRLVKWHWILIWDGRVYDPGGCWPDSYANWKITSYLEIHS